MQRVSPVPIEARGGTLYERVAERMESLIDGGTLRPGDKIPSVRKLSEQLSVSISTVLEAYRLLEDRGIVEARPQSGYYVRPRLEPPPVPRQTIGTTGATSLDIGDLILRIVSEASQPDIVPLGAALPSPEFFPVARLNRDLSRAIRDEPERSQGYDTVRGLPALRVQIARRLLEAGCSLTPDEIVTTPGAQAALHLCLRAVTKPGDTVAIESPTFYGLLEALESLHLKALEVATDPREGVCPEALTEVVESGRVTACAFVPSFGNPLGHLMPDAKKKWLVDFLAKKGIPLIEDDVYGDLPFGTTRPKAAKAFDRTGNVLYCASFSKTLAPGYRIGWTAPGRHHAVVERLKFSASVATATPPQMAVARFLASGGFDRHLRRLRRNYRDLVDRFSRSVGQHFPIGTRITRPEGGHVVWVELPRGVDTLRLHEDALAEGVSIAPGPIFSANQRYRNCLRLNCALSWTPRVEGAIRTLASLVERQRIRS